MFINLIHLINSHWSNALNIGSMFVPSGVANRGACALTFGPEGPIKSPFGFFSAREDAKRSPYYLKKFNNASQLVSLSSISVHRIRVFYMLSLLFPKSWRRCLCCQFFKNVWTHVSFQIFNKSKHVIVHWIPQN